MKYLLPLFILIFAFTFQSHAKNCNSTLSTNSVVVEPSVGTISINVTIPNECIWTGTNVNAYFVDAPTNERTRSGVIVLTLEQNSGAQRVGNVEFAGQPLTITQKANCT